MGRLLDIVKNMGQQTWDQSIDFLGGYNEEKLPGGTRHEGPQMDLSQYITKDKNTGEYGIDESPIKMQGPVDPLQVATGDATFQGGGLGNMMMRNPLMEAAQREFPGPINPEAMSEYYQGDERLGQVQKGLYDTGQLMSDPYQLNMGMEGKEEDNMQYSLGEEYIKGGGDYKDLGYEINKIAKVSDQTPESEANTEESGDGAYMQAMMALMGMNQGGGQQAPPQGVQFEWRV